MKALPVATLVLAVLPAPTVAAQDDSLRRRLNDNQVGEGWIYDDWGAARKLATAEGKPIFAVFRCVP